MIQVITYSKSQKPFLLELEDSSFLDSLIDESELKLQARPVCLKSIFKKDNNDFSIERSTLLYDSQHPTYSIKIRDGFLPDKLIEYLSEAKSIRNSDGEPISFKEFLALLKN
jgi:hypothetical protein